MLKSDLVKRIMVVVLEIVFIMYSVNIIIGSKKAKVGITVMDGLNLPNDISRVYVIASNPS